MDFARSREKGGERGRSERLPLCFADYLALLQWAGQQLRQDKRGALPPTSRELLERLGLEPARWLDTVRSFHLCFLTAAGSEARIREHGRRRGLLCLRGARLARDVYTGAA